MFSMLMLWFALRQVCEGGEQCRSDPPLRGARPESGGGTPWGGQAIGGAQSFHFLQSWAEPLPLPRGGYGGQGGRGGEVVETQSAQSCRVIEWTP